MVKLISIHVPRCGGNTWLSILNQLFVVSHQNFQWIEDVDPEVECIHGHFPSIKYDELYPKAQKITWIRDPLDRLISNYLLDMGAHWEPMNNGWDDRLRSGEIEFMEYVRRFPNGIRSYLPEPVDAYAFIGLVEHWARCWKAFKLAFCPKTMVYMEKLNAGEPPVKRAIKDSLGTKELKKIRRLNQRDYYLYEKVKKQWKV